MWNVESAAGGWEESIPSGFEAGERRGRACGKHALGNRDEIIKNVSTH